jgi:hypothetical protein
MDTRCNFFYVFIPQIFLDTFVCEANRNATKYFFFEVRTHTAYTWILIADSLLNSFKIRLGRCVIRGAVCRI